MFARYTGKVLPFDVRAATRHAKVPSERERAGLPIDAPDAQIAAICRSKGAVLATRNLKDFHATGVELLDPWQPGGWTATRETAGGRRGIEPDLRLG